MRNENIFDVIIVGGGPAGLSAALVLGRACRKVLVCDSNQPRNWASKQVHGFIGVDGINPRELVRKTRDQLVRLDTVTIWDNEVVNGHRWQNEFEIMTKDGRSAASRKMLLATGVTDELPPIAGAEACFGKSLFQCPYCDGWEARGKPIAIYGRGARSYTMARALFGWSRDLVICTDGPSGLMHKQRETLDRHGILVREEPIEQFEEEGGKLRSIQFRNGEKLERSFVFFNLPSKQKSALAEGLGCEFTEELGVKTGRYESTNVPGLYVAGNMIKDVHLAIVAAAEGARAALGINKALAKEDFAVME
ncbi:MAG: NAD(P)/FAD-dependent oxidoreductase [Pseudobdellovibrionaceae bacterium]|nr:NAD(P)/FAD-dependent oxidoreductase [Pseudobdellovibrionaceae bacterium]